MSEAQVTFSVAWVISADGLYIAGALDGLGKHAPFSRLFQYAEEMGPDSWSKHDVEWEAISLTTYFPPQDDDGWSLVAMSVEGHFEFSPGTGRFAEKIEGAGVFSEGAKFWGYMSAIRQIGDHLYAIGDGGQVYRRDADNQWSHMDDGLLQSPNVDSRLLLADIQAADESDIYICGGLPGAFGYEGCLYRWNGMAWILIELPTSERLTSMYREAGGALWICGANGTLLQGDAVEGFVDVSTVHDNQLFYSLTKFNGMIYLASNLGLFMYDGTSITKVQTGLFPELQGVGSVDAIDGVLWSIGSKDIAKFDGHVWTRIDHPDNPRIR